MEKLILVGVMAVSAIGAISGCSNEDDNAQSSVSAENTVEATTNQNSEQEQEQVQEHKYTNGNITVYEAYDILKDAGLIHSEPDEYGVHNAPDFVNAVHTDEVDIEEYTTHAGAAETTEPSVHTYAVKNIYIYVKDIGNTDKIVQALKDGVKKHNQ